MLTRRNFLTLLGTAGANLFLKPHRFRKKFIKKEIKRMTYSVKDFSHLMGMKGFSENLLKNHFSLYQGYVTNTNKILETLNEMLNQGKIQTPEFSELKRRLGWEFNGMRLHEYYFENLGGKEPLNLKGKLGEKIMESFGSYESWEKDFKASGLMRGIGWVVLFEDNINQRLMNFWINEHDVGHPAGCIPILVMDVFEHAFMLDYDLKKADYIQAFFNNIDWKKAEERLK